MVTQSKISPPQSFKPALDILLISFGIVGGGLIALAGIWLWFDYRAGASQSLLALISAQLVTHLPLESIEFLQSQAQIMGLPLTAETSAYWYMARSGGIVAYLLVWFSTVWGLILSTKITGKLIAMPVAYGLHEFLSLLALVFAGLHAVVLLGDSYINFNIFHLAVPFISSYEPFWTGLGTIALYLGIALTGSFYARKLIGQKVWRKLHALTFLFFLLALLHGLMAGSDSKLLLVKLMYWGTGFSVLFLTYFRLFTLKDAARKPVQRAE